MAKVLIYNVTFPILFTSLGYTIWNPNEIYLKIIKMLSLR